MPDADPILLELYRHRFEGVADEMGVTLRRTSHSPNIKERLDFSCAVFDGDGTLVAQAAHIPVHLGAMPASVDAARAAVDTWGEGDVVILNDPYAGGTHLPDVTMVSPVFVGDADAPSFFVASRAHHADVGGMTPGSLPLATELVQEGLVLPPVKLYGGGTRNDALLHTILRNVRTPDERRGDLAAQRAAHSVGAERLQALAHTHGADEVSTYARSLQAYSERRTRAALADWPDGTYSFADALEVGDDETAAIRVTAMVEGDAITFDFAGTDDAERIRLLQGLHRRITRVCHVHLHATEAVRVRPRPHAAADGFVVREGGPVRARAAEGEVVHRALAGGGHAVGQCLRERPEHRVDDALGGFHVAARHCVGRRGVDE